MSLNTAHKLLGSTTLPTITCGKGNILCHRNSLFQPVQEWLQSCRVELKTPIGQGSNSTSLLGLFHHGLLYLRHRHLGWPTLVDTFPTWWSHHQIALLRYCSSLTSYDLGSSNMDCIIGSSNTWTAFKVKKSLFRLLEYVSCKHTHHPNPNLQQLFH